MDDPLVVTLLSCLPRRGVSTMLGRWARTPSRWLTRAFVWAYDVDLSDAERPAAAYGTLDALFTRRLKLGARPIDRRPDVLVSPVDATVAWVGSTEGPLPLGPSPVAFDDVAGDPTPVRAAAVLYLSPRDYHRVHAPEAGRLVAYRYVRGTRWPVFPAAVRRIPRLFARNERLVLSLATARGRWTIAMIGALGVGRIVSPQVGGALTADVRGPLHARVARGEELGVFHLGSTVVLGLQTAPERWCVRAGEAVRTGRPLARFGPVAPSAK